MSRKHNLVNLSGIPRMARHFNLSLEEFMEDNLNLNQ